MSSSSLPSDFFINSSSTPPPMDNHPAPPAPHPILPTDVAATSSSHTLASMSQLPQNPSLSHTMSPRFSHLPTPHSPDPTSQPYTVVSPESPLAYLSRPPQFTVPSPFGTPFDAKPVQASSTLAMMTPESSPVSSRTVKQSSPSLTGPIATNFIVDRTPPNQMSSLPPLTPQQSISSSMMLDSPISIAPSRADTVPSTLSSPFMARLDVSERRAGSKTPHRSPAESSSPPTPSMILSEDAFAQAANVSRNNTPVPHQAGGELDRIRQKEFEDQLVHQREAETRRPEYLRRQKRTIAEADPTYDDDRIGILDSPQKGRRIKLFQETSEESFEESLMAGGYGRYRTAEWVRQPQPIVVTTSKPAVTPPPEESTPPPVSSEPPSEKDILRQKRLAAFRGDTMFGPVSRLYPVDIPGRGRTLVDRATEEAHFEKKKGVGAAANKKGKKKETGAPSPLKRSSVSAGPTNDVLDINWPDATFPWSVRAHERAESARLEEAERLRFLERFFDRESDEEDSDSESQSDSDEEIMPSTQFGELYEDEADRPLPPRRGRGKMIGLPANPEATFRQPSFPATKKVSALFPSDPADARAALMAKKSARSLHYRRKRPEHPLNNEQVVCICHHSGRGPLVQCDSCDTWYHMHCIGIEDEDELGDEDDLWYCEACAAHVIRSRGQTPEPLVAHQDPMAHNGPTLVKGDESTQRPPRAAESSPFHSLAPEAPMPAWLSRSRAGKSRLSIGSTDDQPSDVSWAPPRTPGGRGSGGNFSTKYGGIDALDLPATPNRLRQPMAPSIFQTPKNGPMSRLPTSNNNIYNTQLKTPRSRKVLGAPGSLPAVLDDGTNLLFSPRMSFLGMGIEDSPTRRSSRPSTSFMFETPRAGGNSSRGLSMMTTTANISTPRYLGHYPVDESPIYRSKGKERAMDCEL